MLTLWNTRSRSLEAFTPLEENEVGMYACGPTVYGELTLGNWRKYINDDVLRRVFLMEGYRVNHVVNITDVGHLVDDADVGEDKVEREAQKRGKTAWDIAHHYEQRFHEGMEAFHLLPPTSTPRATEHIAEQIRLVQHLEATGHAYRTSDGVYFDTSTFPAYGALSGQKLEEKEASGRVETNNEKRHPADFALWKLSPPGEQRSMEWESPWGVGFPGWHIECSAMSVAYLGQPFDVHTGGVDHVAIHHENEIAQSETDGISLARFWVHHEFLMVDGGRMGKSLGNGYVLDDLVKRGVDPIVYRFFVLGAHYRSKLNFTWEALEGAEHALEKLKKSFLSWGEEEGEPDQPTCEAFRTALEEDVHLPKALAVLWECVKSEMPSSAKRATLLLMDDVLGLGMRAWKEGVQADIPEEVTRLAEARWQAKKEKNWAEADRLRKEIASHGWQMEDGVDGWKLTP